ncbi:hypothetical protein [Quadrisphaera sp. DSM 44207]|uniref:hypothetical protein n=1 Tax=Quadrisphaera sp. DSM 44207 TaxID=1881057 RepID=UPI000880184B|nr:hypothetical protein [Quadrisphaera sp. DSM 44207]SDQ34591.1 hypothetical protein SAMN05428996_1333 [Quadrisphaera sp. DSM 44207]
MSTLTWARSTAIPSPRSRDTRPCTLSRCDGTAAAAFTTAGLTWYRCSCGLEFPETARSRA